MTPTYDYAMSNARFTSTHKQMSRMTHVICCALLAAIKSEKDYPQGSNIKQLNNKKNNKKNSILIYCIY